MISDLDYRTLCADEPSAMEQVYAIFANVLEFEADGRVTNFAHAQRRATDYLRKYLEKDFEVVPPYQDWELELHAPPPLKDRN